MLSPGSDSDAQCGAGRVTCLELYCSGSCRLRHLSLAMLDFHSVNRPREVIVVVLRGPRLDELAELSALCLSSKAVWGYEPSFLEACRSELTLQPDDLLDSRIAVAEVNASIVGVVQVKTSAADAELLKLFVAPHHLRHGVGRILFDWAVAQAQDMNAARLVIEADPDAAPYYRRMGACDDGLAASGSIPGRLLPRLILDVGQRRSAPATATRRPGNAAPQS